MATLMRKEARFEHMNTRTEKSGDEDVLACDLRIAMMLPNSFLDELHLGLRAALYERPQESDLLSDDDHRPNLSFPRLAPLSWEQEWSGMTVTLHYGIRDDGDIVLPNARINKMVLALKDGGSVEVKFRVQFRPALEEHPEYMGKLAQLLENKSITISVEKPEQPAEGESDGQGVIDGTSGPSTSSNPAMDDAEAKAGDATLTPPEPTKRRRARATIGADA